MCPLNIHKRGARTFSAQVGFIAGLVAYLVLTERGVDFNTHKSELQSVIFLNLLLDCISSLEKP